MKEFINGILITAISGLIVSLICYLCKIYIKNRPRLILHIGRDRYSQRINHDYSHILKWTFDCVLSNNSDFTAYDVKVYTKSRNASSSLFKNISGKEENLFLKNNFVSNENAKFELATIYNTKPYELLNTKMEGNERICYPGLKIKNPEKELRPEDLDNFKLLIEYKNSKGIKFYTLYSKNKNKEFNKFHFFKFKAK